MHIGEIVSTAFLLFLVVGTAGYVMSIYNSLVAIRNHIGRAWANIDVMLKQRHDELPKLVKTCEGYMQHERAIFDKLSEARGALANARTVGQKADAENLLTRAIGQFFAVAEAYPDLKANVSFQQLQARITEIENHIADRREFYNDIVTTFNTRIAQIPSMYVARWMALQPAELFKVDAADRADVEIKFAMAS